MCLKITLTKVNQLSSTPNVIFFFDDKTKLTPLCKMLYTLTFYCNTMTTCYTIWVHFSWWLPKYVSKILIVFWNECTNNLCAYIFFCFLLYLPVPVLKKTQTTLPPAGTSILDACSLEDGNVDAVLYLKCPRFKPRSSWLWGRCYHHSLTVLPRHFRISILRL